MLIAVAGMVGSGKTTLTTALATRFGLQRALESVDGDNPWLEKYYGETEGRRRYALQLQLHFLATRFAALRQMRAIGGSWILDRTWYEDAEIFARGLFDQGLLGIEEFQLYEALYRELLYSPAARPPRLLVYLQAPLDVIVARIEQRGRRAERDTELPYWEALHERYEQWIKRFRYAPVLRIDVRDYDLYAEPEAIEEVAGLVRQRIEKDLPQTELWPPSAPPRSALAAG